MKYGIKLIALMVIFVMISTILVGVAQSNSIENKSILKIKTILNYPNSDITTLWVRKNGSDPLFDYSNANVTPSVGMNYFGTNNLVIYIDTVGSGEYQKYSWTDINNTLLFPSNIKIWVHEFPSVASMTAVANQAVWDSRIKGFLWDDFSVGLQSPANMSDLYDALHHEDGSLSEPLKLVLVVYNRNYYKQLSYTWDEISPYFDIISYWYFPDTYSLLYPGLAGYTDGFMDMYNRLPTKEYWIGIYLHYYNLGNYPLNFTYEQMSNAGKLVEEGYVTKLLILENFWIQHNPNTAKIVKNFINNEIQKHYSTTWYFGTQTILSYINGIPTLNKLLVDVVSFEQFFSRDSSYLFTSTYLQNLTVKYIDVGGPIDKFIIWNLRTGNHQYPYYDSINETISYIIEPSQRYRIISYGLTSYNYTNLNINSPTNWDSRLITINGVLRINSTLGLSYCILRFGTNNYDNSMLNITNPKFGIIIKPDDSAKFRIYDSIIEPVNRAFPYYLNRTLDYVNGTADTELIWTRSVIACYSWRFVPAGKIYIIDSTIFQTQPCIENLPTSLWLMGTSNYIRVLHVIHSTIFNYEMVGSVGMFLMPGNLVYVDGGTKVNFWFEDNTIIGSQYALWIDMTFFVGDELTLESYTSYGTNPTEVTNYNPGGVITNWNCFTTFRLDGLPEKQVTVETINIFNWSIKGASPAPTFKMQYTYINIGIYTLTINGVDSQVAITTNTAYILYTTAWNVYRDNFTFLPFSTFTSPGNTMNNIIWLLFVFIIPICMAQVVPKIGFTFGMILSLIIWGIQDLTFIPYMFVGFIAIAIMVYKDG